MTAYLDLNEKLDETGIEYESYLQNMGRQLFYTIASSYITLYLAIVFLVVANTIVGVQFLMSQQKTGRRYQTLIRLGATYETLCQSAGKPVSYTHLVSLRLHEIKDIVVVTLDRFPVFPDTVTLRKLKVVGNKPL